MVVVLAVDVGPHDVARRVNVVWMGSASRPGHIERRKGALVQQVAVGGAGDRCFRASHNEAFGVHAVGIGKALLIRHFRRFLLM
jgi:hypothetical protein